MTISHFIIDWLTDREIVGVFYVLNDKYIKCNLRKKIHKFKKSKYPYCDRWSEFVKWNIDYQSRKRKLNQIKKKKKKEVKQNMRVKCLKIKIKYWMRMNGKKKSSIKC